MTIEANNADDLWNKAAIALLESEPLETKSKDDVCRELINTTLVLTDPWLNKSCVSRKMNLEYAENEIIWYDKKTRNPEYISQYSKFWNHLTDDCGEVNSNYGWCIYKKYFNQWDHVIQLLKHDPSTRRAVIHIKEPIKYPKIARCKDVNCTLTLQFLIRNNRLNLIVNMRSNDIWYGTPYDIYYFTVLLFRMSQELNLCFGTYYHNVGSLHMYQRNYDKIVDRVNNYTYNSDTELDYVKYQITNDSCANCDKDPVNCSIDGYCKYKSLEG